MSRFDYAVYIGRFQPCHNGHLSVIEQALEAADQVIVLIGSCNVARNPKNPFTVDERVSMIYNSLTESQRGRVKFGNIRDYLYDDSKWVTEVQNTVNNCAGRDASIALIGYHKDASSYYLDLFPEWKFIHATPKVSTNATDVRELLYKQEGFFHLVPAPVGDALVAFKIHSAYQELLDEDSYYSIYKRSFSGPYPPTFVTADSVVLQNNHVLLVERKDCPGRGLYALPGGFLKTDETVLASAMRELREETCILYPERELRAKISDVKVFDHPARSLRGRVITHAHCIRLSEKTIPRVQGADDASKAFWLPTIDIYRNENKFFEDHFSIIDYFISK